MHGPVYDALPTSSSQEQRHTCTGGFRQCCYISVANMTFPQLQT